MTIYCEITENAVTGGATTRFNFPHMAAGTLYHIQSNRPIPNTNPSNLILPSHPSLCLA
jgi:hypothetical protein